jgi:hypothetical protein
MRYRLNYLEHNSTIYVWDSRDEALNRLVDSSGQMEMVLDEGLGSLVIEHATPITKEDAWRRILKSENKPTTVLCSTCQKNLELYKDPICNAYRDGGSYVGLCEQCFCEEYNGIAEPSGPYPKPPVDLSEQNPNQDFVDKYILVLTEDPPWAIRADHPPPKGRSIIIVNYDAYMLKHRFRE